ncbi:hypothetical protein [Mesoplasma melaleucae]|uniref:hypothetical protein n=1 Tax=Mesoplasma melaleucae TaxID=81459 RepID=UPI000487DCA3|nr:hypothetical protein [Mesoplasma melaleucae]
MWRYNWTTANVKPTIKKAKAQFETIEFKNSDSAQTEVEKKLKSIAGIKNVTFNWNDESSFKYNVQIDYVDNFFGPSLLMEHLKNINQLYLNKLMIKILIWEHQVQFN